MPPPFYSIVSAVIIARQRRRDAIHLRTLRVAMESYCGLHGVSLMVDQWVSYSRTPCSRAPPRSDVERLVAYYPRLADLTIEACRTVTALSIVGGACLRRLALLRCNNLMAVAIDSSELQAFLHTTGAP